MKAVHATNGVNAPAARETSADSQFSFPYIAYLMQDGQQPLSNVINALTRRSDLPPDAAAVGADLDLSIRQVGSLLAILADYTRVALNEGAGNIPVNSDPAADLPNALSLASAIATVQGSAALALSEMGEKKHE